MRRLIVPCAAVLCLSVAPTAPAQEPSGPRESPVIVTVGRSSVKAAPDRAFVTVSTEATAPAPAAAQQKIAESMTAVRAKLKAALVPDDAVKTVAYSLQEEAEYPNGRRVLKGYRARNTIEVRVDEIGKVGAVIDAAVSAGANAVGDIRFDLKDRDAVERDALKKAVLDARARAEALASGAGVTIAAILRIDEQGLPSPIPRPAPMMAMRAAAVSDAPETPVTAGEIEVTATVTLTAAIR
jgi:uncharacterized protein YggE